MDIFLTSADISQGMDLQSIGKYEILSTLGRGSMGVVYKAQDPEIGRVVAIKTLRTVLMGDDPQGQEALARFRQESRSAGKLQHPNIVTIFEAGRAENGSPYIVMEHIDGQSFEGMLKVRGALEPLEALHYLSQVAHAIDYAHANGVIHRDIKPSNVIVDAMYRPHLLDFGVAKLSDTSLTPAGAVVGTPSYMSPEQIRGEQLDGGADRFAFAVVTFELLTGKRPFPGTDFTTVVSNIIHRDPLRFSDLGVNLSGEIEEILKRGLAKARDERFLKAYDFVKALAKALGVAIDHTGIIGGFTPGMVWKGAAEFSTTSKADTGETMSMPLMFPSTADSVSSDVTNRSTEEDSRSNEPVGDSVIDSTPVGGRSLSATLVFVGGCSIFFAVVVIAIIYAVKPTLVSNVLDSWGINSKKILSGEGVDVSVPTKFTPKVPTGGVGVLTESQLGSISDEELAYVLKSPEASESLLKAAIQSSFQRGSEELVKMQSALLGHSSYLMRLEVLKGLGASPRLTTTGGIGLLEEALLDKDFLVRGYAGRLLGRTGSQRALAVLKAAQVTESNEKVRAVIDQAIGQLQGGVLTQ